MILYVNSIDIYYSESLLIKYIYHVTILFKERILVHSIVPNIKFRICIVICMLILIGFIESYSQHNILKPIMYIIIVMIFNMLAL